MIKFIMDMELREIFYSYIMLNNLKIKDIKLKKIKSEIFKLIKNGVVIRRIISVVMVRLWIVLDVMIVYCLRKVKDVEVI